MKTHLILTLLMSVLFSSATYAQYTWRTYTSSRGATWTRCLDSQGVPAASINCERQMPQNAQWRPYSSSRRTRMECADVSRNVWIDNSICRAKFPPRYEWRTYSPSRGRSVRECIEVPRGEQVPNTRLCPPDVFEWTRIHRGSAHEMKCMNVATNTEVPDSNCTRRISVDDCDDSTPQAVRPLFNLIDYLGSGPGI